MPSFSLRKWVKNCTTMENTYFPPCVLCYSSYLIALNANLLQIQLQFEANSITNITLYSH